MHQEQSFLHGSSHHVHLRHLKHESDPEHDHSAHEAIEAAQRCYREAETFVGGAAKGAWNTAQKRWSKNPAGVIGEAIGAGLTGLTLACAAEAAPLVTLGVGTAATANYLWSIANPSTHAARNKELIVAWKAAWDGVNSKQLDYYEQKVADRIGAAAFDFALCTTFGTGGFAARQFAISPTIDNPFTAMSQFKTNANQIDTTGMLRTMRTTQVSGPDSGAMRDFIGGDVHALERGRLRLHPSRSIRLENRRRHPSEHSLLNDYAVHVVHD